MLVVGAVVVWMIVADFVFAVAFDVAMLVTMLTASVLLRLFALRRRRIDLRYRPRRRPSRSRRRAAGYRAKKNQADGHEPHCKPRRRGAIVPVTHKTPHGFQVSETRMSGATLQAKLARPTPDLAEQNLSG